MDLNLPRWVIVLLKTLSSLLGLGLVSLFFFWLFCLNFVENYEFGYKFDKWTGERTMLVDEDGKEKKGWICTAPWVSVYTTDLRPVQVCINANSRVLNCKLVQFDMKGFDLFISWHGMQDYSNDGAQAGGGNLAEILKSYAYDGSGKDYPFLKVLRELGGEEKDSTSEDQATVSIPPALSDTSSAASK